MQNLFLTIVLFALLLLSASAGFAIRKRLHERHLSREKVEGVRLLMGMLLTFSALVLGLLTSAAKDRFDAYGKELSAYAANLIELDHRLRTYGPDADEIRQTLRRYTAAAIADTWPDEPHPTGEYPHLARDTAPAAVEDARLGDLLNEVDVKIERLAATDAYHQQIAARLRARMGSAIERRWQLILSAPSTISWPFLLILATWLSVIYAIFALTTPRDGLIDVVILLSALSIASPLYLILDYSGSQSGLLRLPSDAMRTALAHMDRPN